MSSEDHDRVIGYVRAMHHFALLALGVALGNWDGDLKTSSIARALDRIEGLLDSWGTIVEIQSLNPHSPVVRREFIETCMQLVGMQQSDVSDVERTLQSNVHKWSRKL